MAQLLNITVNGKPAVQFLSQEKSREIEQFLAEEMRSFGRMTRSHVTSHSTKSHGYERKAPPASVIYVLDHVESEV
jgi:hypothetical protein